MFHIHLESVSEILCFWLDNLLHLAILVERILRYSLAAESAELALQGIILNYFDLLIDF